MSERRAPYENQLIGAFLVGMGYYGGTKQYRSPISANLFQQTPQDPAYGDLLVGATHFLALEFKRSTSRTDLAAEVDKWDIAALRQWFEEEPGFLGVARRVHQLVCGQPQNRQSMSWQSYMDAILGLGVYPAVENQGPPHVGCLFEQLYKPTYLGREPKTVLTYLSRVQKFRKTAVDSASGGVSAVSKEPSFLAVAVNAEGQLRFIVEDNFTLILNHELRRQRELQEEQQRGRAKEQAHGKSGPSRGLSR